MAVRITVQRITVVINRRRKIFAFEGVGAAATASDIRGKISGASGLANSQLPVNFSPGFKLKGVLKIPGLFEMDKLIAHFAGRPLVKSLS